MSTTSNIKQVDTSNTSDINHKQLNSTIKSSDVSDADLVQIAGNHAYNRDDIDKFISVNGNEYELIDITPNGDGFHNNSGLDAIALKKVDSDEIVIAYVGSEQTKEDWIETNAKLIHEDPPQQLQDAVDYYEYVKDKYKDVGTVTHVTGNSLGGALANAVAVENENVRSVTLNPALLPYGLLKDKEYDNIVNYMGTYDILTGTLEHLRLEGRIPGEHYKINHGLQHLDMFITNHTGYLKGNDPNNFQIGESINDPGYGTIRIAADFYVATSLFTGESLHGGPSTKIKIDADAMRNLADGIANINSNEFHEISEYINNSREIVEYEHEKFQERVEYLQEKLQLLIEQIALHPVFNNIASSGNYIITIIDGLIDLVDIIEGKLGFLNIILDSKPMEIIEYVSNTNINVESLISPVRLALNTVQQTINDFIFAVSNMFNDIIPDLFKGGTDFFIDAVSGELNAHYEIVQTNKDKLLQQLKQYSMQVGDIADVFEETDNKLGNAISNGTHDIPNTDITPVDPVTLDESPYLGLGMKIKEIQIEMARGQLSLHVTRKIVPVLITIEAGLIAVETALESVLFAINSTTSIVLNGNPASLIIDLFTDFKSKVRNAVNEVKQPIVDLENKVEDLRKAVARLIMGLPNITNDLLPYIDTAIFASNNFSNVALYNAASQFVLEKTEMVFSDIIYQLSQEEGGAIEANVEASKNIVKNIETLKEQISKGTF